MRRWTITQSKFLNEGQLSVLKKYADSRPINERGVLLGLFYTGLRVHEAALLRVEDYQTDRITVQRGKGGHGRDVLLTEDAQIFFKELIGTRTTGPMFLSRFGRGFSKRGMQRVCERTAKALGIKLHAHMMRHTYCTTLIKAGESLPMVRDQLGHSSIAITDLYTHSCGQLKIKKLI
jgi:integrase